MKSALSENVSALNKAIKENNTALVHMIQNNITAIEGKISKINGDVSNIKDDVGAIDAKNKAQDGAIGTSSTVAYAGVGLALLALIIALLGMMRSGKRGKGIEHAPEEVPMKEEHTEEDEFEEF